MEFDPEFTHIRRQDRRVDDDAWIVAFLQRAAFGVLATSVQDQPFVNINLFAYDPEKRAVYLHHASRGRTMENLRRNRRVCFTAAEMGRLLPAAQARWAEISGADRVHFCGAYWGWGFHEDGCVSGVRVARQLGEEL